MFNWITNGSSSGEEPSPAQGRLPQHEISIGASTNGKINLHIETREPSGGVDRVTISMTPKDARTLSEGMFKAACQVDGT